MMASRKKSNDSFRSVSKDARRHVGGVMFSSSSSSEEDVTTGCRSCRNTSNDYFTRNPVEKDSQTGQETQKNDENPFSFKHFLKNGSQVNYQNAGARPKVYPSTATPSCPYNVGKDTAVYSRNPTELPDFVQDHLVIEQYYINHEPKQQTVSDIDNLPDFTLNSVEQRQNRLRSESKKSESHTLRDLSFDLTGNIDKGLLQRNQSAPSTSCSAHLDLPVFVRSNVGCTDRPESSGFPLDLPIPIAESTPGSNVVVRDCSHSGTSDSNLPKSLPDFLNDGPIHNRTTESGTVPNNSESTERRLLMENERLRHELELAQKQVNDKAERIQLLESELTSRRDVEHLDTMHLEKAMEQVEDNLKRSTRRAVNAESTVSSLKEEIKSLTSEISLLRLENEELKSGVANGNRNEYGSSNVNQTIRKLASDLRNAASSADVSLRQLMSGVDNLRVLASALENVDRIEDRTKDFLPDCDEDNATGPAL